MDIRMVVWEWLCNVDNDILMSLAKEYGCEVDVGEIDNLIEDKEAFAIEYGLI